MYKTQFRNLCGAEYSKCEVRVVIRFVQAKEVNQKQTKDFTHEGFIREDYCRHPN